MPCSRALLTFRYRALAVFRRMGLRTGFVGTSSLVLLALAAPTALAASFQFETQTASAEITPIEEICDGGLCVEIDGGFGAGSTFSPSLADDEDLAETVTVSESRFFVTPPTNPMDVARHRFETSHGLRDVSLSLETESIGTIPFGPLRTRASISQAFQVDEATAARLTGNFSADSVFNAIPRIRLCDIGGSCDSFASAFDVFSQFQQGAFDVTVQLEPGVSYALLLSGEQRAIDFESFVSLTLIPEPNTACLIGLGLWGLSARRRDAR